MKTEEAIEDLLHFINANVWPSSWNFFDIVYAYIKTDLPIPSRIIKWLNDKGGWQLSYERALERERNESKSK
jgi:hypothetical protein